MLNQKLTVCLRVFVYIHSQDHTTAPLNSFLESIQGGRFCDARRAPTRPEVQHHHFSLQARKPCGHSVHFQCEIFRSFSCDGGFALAVMRHGKSDKNQYTEPERDPNLEFSQQIYADAILA